MVNKTDKTYFYPQLGAEKDLWAFRLGGHGIGNGLYNYFHALVLCTKNNGTIITPAWPTLKLGPLLRGERSKRLYWRLFKADKGDISGLKKMLTLLNNWNERNVITVNKDTPLKSVKQGALNIITCDQKFSFDGLYDFRDLIRAKFQNIIRDDKHNNINWGNGEFIAIHIRLGDFKIETDINVIKKGGVNMRIPMSWYIGVIKSLKRAYGDMPVYVFSDGKDSDLKELTDNGVKIYRGETDLDDLLKLSEASILVGSRSTFSYWAAFLGNMKSIWLDTEIRDSKIPHQEEKLRQYIAFNDIPNEILFE